MSASVLAEKAALRRDLLDRRARRTAEERRDAGEALALHALATPALARGARVACYLSFEHEPDTGALIAGLRGHGLEVIAPSSRPVDHTLDWVLVGDEGNQPGAYGIPEPAGERLGPEALSSCAVAFVPALAVDHRGRRLGRGAGYYDRALARFSGLVCAVVYSDELLETIPAEPHDVPVDLALTPAGIFRPER
ncbi:5-formyltetrahydrofolate cyclo-ligase [Aeromicrobium camelliae]|uniref:5-formyltetrahydrofolate cyclo-ligase n=1 Tax=Aeromicrobium camelliae TaxID=1538144 RepID=A0A3N6WYG4_9ACTN|nr:5-formyltetrahydrofolate cyclo-ligase [Aeromicrobium camelliae]RQN10082.1 5-formyltetrahydrofolate cyclo-ligase [Aeromicrobium camelliae]